MQPVPTSESNTENKISELKKIAEKQIKCIKCLSWFFIITGIAGILNGFYCMSTAAENAKYIVVHKKLPWGRKKLPIPEPTKDEDRYMLTDELELYDILKNIGMLTLCLSFVILCVGKMNRWAIYTKKGKWVHRIFHKSIASFFAFNFFYFLTKGQGKAFMSIFMKLADDETRTHMEQHMKGKIGMCPVMLVLIIVQLLNIYKLRNYDHSIEKVELLEEVKKEQDEKDRILQAASQFRAWTLIKMK